MNAFSFVDPEYFFLLIIPLLTVVWVVFKGKENTAKLEFSDTSFLQSKTSKKTYFINLPFYLRVFSSILLIFALARPQSSINWEESTIEGIDIVLAMDISASMLAEDLSPNRLESSKNVAISFIRKRVNDRIGLVVFSGESFTQCPLTTDHDVLVNLTSDIQTADWLTGGTAIGMGLLTAVNRLNNSKAKSKVIILITDGVNNTGDFTPASAAELAKKFDICVYTIGVGKDGEAKIPVGKDLFGRTIYQTVEGLDKKTLQDIALTTNGKFYRATSNSSLNKVYNEIDNLEKSKIEISEFHKKSEEFLSFATASLFLFMLAFILQITLFKKII